MKPAQWRGTWSSANTYGAGELVVVRAHSDAVYISRRDGNISAPPTLNDDNNPWVYLGKAGPSASRVIHKWHPQRLQYPVDEGMSEPVEVCADCWKDADFKNAFLPSKHLFVIQELM